MTDYAAWARRRSGRPQPPPDPVEVAAPQQMSAPTALPPLPPGYVYVPHAQYGFVAMPTAAVMPTTVAVPGAVPTRMVHVPTPQQWGAVAAPATTCVLVKPGGEDLYAKLLAGLPDLVPPTPYDAMAGNPSPAVQAVLGGHSEFIESFTQGAPVARARAVQAGNVAPLAELAPGAAPAPASGAA
jgi:hypothetical protein